MLFKASSVALAIDLNLATEALACSSSSLESSNSLVNLKASVDNCAVDEAPAGEAAVEVLDPVFVGS
ncbi:hypothetical protein WICPIJ_004897 [Wickerhamomyces pijperi]|uniref:Secreted protein n=1 Tax=Wickerhamomyces pijperi TaxID=599730 RepID=A0A9P8Q703_WICPI|nr:hypothetical protein WICPIJ_004897 [Wickerhamomyces pijperi]